VILCQQKAGALNWPVKAPQSKTASRCASRGMTHIWVIYHFPQGPFPPVVHHRRDYWQASDAIVIAQLRQASSGGVCEGASIMTTRQRTCFSACAGKLDFSSREESALREHETCFVTRVCRGVGADILKAALVADQTAFWLENET
jgi:hypothetical protein